MSPKAKRDALEKIRVKHTGLSSASGCKLVGLEQSTLYYKAHRARHQVELEDKMRKLAEEKPSKGRPYFIWYIREKLKMHENHKRITRIYRDLGLQLAKRPKRKRKGKSERHLYVAPSRPNEVWAMDFVSDALASGRRFRILTLKDLFTHESLCLHVDRSIRGDDVAVILNRVIEERQKPKSIVCDNGTEYTSQAMSKWEHATGIRLQFIRPGKPIDNAFIESFNGKLRRECLDQNWFRNIDEARDVIEAWRIEYNTDRPTQPLGNITPSEFAKRYETSVRAQNKN